MSLLSSYRLAIFIAILKFLNLSISEQVRFENAPFKLEQTACYCTKYNLQVCVTSTCSLNLGRFELNMFPCPNTTLSNYLLRCR